MSDPQLMNLLKFDESDLQANRNGSISEGQMVRLQKMEANAKKVSLLGCAGNFFVALIGLGAAAFMITTEGSPELNLSFGTICFGTIFGILWPLLWGSAGYLGLRRVFAKVEATVKKAEGTIAIEKTVRSSYDSDSHVTTHHNVYELRVGGYTFIVNPVLSNYMKRGEIYTVYFADFNHKEKSKEILSVELLTNTHSISAPQTIPEEDAAVVGYAKAGNMLEAIRTHRLIHGSSLEEAKAIVDDIKIRIGS
jgi:hypothetical protein